jgi:hypothetical protein
MLAVWGTLLVSTADNWIKPLFIGGRAKLPTFLLLMSILGGLKVYGFLGVFLGPVVLAILFTFVGIYREEVPGARGRAAFAPPSALDPRGGVTGRSASERRTRQHGFGVQHDVAETSAAGLISRNAPDALPRRKAGLLGVSPRRSSTP